MSHHMGQRLTSMLTGMTKDGLEPRSIIIVLNADCPVPSFYIRRTHTSVFGTSLSFPI